MFSTSIWNSSTDLQRQSDFEAHTFCTLDAKVYIDTCKYNYLWGNECKVLLRKPSLIVSGEGALGGRWGGRGAARKGKGGGGLSPSSNLKKMYKGIILRYLAGGAGGGGASENTKNTKISYNYII